MKFQLSSSFAGHKSMEKHDAILGIGEDALESLDRLRSDYADTVKTAMGDHLKLVDRFYHEHEDIFALSNTKPQRRMSSIS
jgi:hypothetical protein